jgi:hypothetical protein
VEDRHQGFAKKRPVSQTESSREVVSCAGIQRIAGGLMQVDRSGKLKVTFDSASGMREHLVRSEESSRGLILGIPYGRLLTLKLRAGVAAVVGAKFSL